MKFEKPLEVKFIALDNSNLFAAHTRNNNCPQQENKLIRCPQRGQEGKGVVFTATLIAVIAHLWFNQHPNHVVSSLGKALYNEYLSLVTSNKLQI